MPRGRSLVFVSFVRARIDDAQSRLRAIGLPGGLYLGPSITIPADDGEEVLLSRKRRQFKVHQPLESAANDPDAHLDDPTGQVQKSVVPASFEALGIVGLGQEQ